MKKNWKQFWTLNRHHAEGFTLVELIVVIAILAILSAVAVPAYSGYITKTHKTNDQTLVSEVSDALQLFYYANPNAGAAWVVLTPDGAVSAAPDANGIPSNGAQAMEAVFGANWATTAALSYDKWTDDGMLGQANADSAIMNSSLLRGNTATELLTNVSNLTTAAAGFVGNRMDNPTLLYSAMAGNFASSEEDFAALCEKYNIETTGEGSNKQFAASVTDTQLSNLMVAAAAKNFTDAANGNAEASTAANLVLMYTTYTAASSSTHATAADKARYDEMTQAIQNAGSVAAVQAALDSYATDAAGLLETYRADTATADNDTAAIMELMNMLNSTELTADDMNDANLFSTGKGANAFRTYVSGSEAMTDMMAAFDGTIPENCIALFLNTDSGAPVVSSSNAEAYLQGK